MIKPILSIIIVNWNTADITVDCLKSVYADKGLCFEPSKDDTRRSLTEIILVDNNSTDDSLAKIKKLKFPVKIIANKENAGFGRANNQGIQIARGNYILLLNSDTIILHSAISQTLDWLSTHPEAWGCTAQLLNADKSIQASGGYFPNLGNITAWSLHFDDLPLFNSLVRPFHPHPPQFYTHEKFFLTDHQQDWITGAYMMVRSEILKKVNGFDPSYFMYGEEMEMCYRIKKAYPQLQCWYLVGPQIIHLGGASSKTKQAVFDREYEGVVSFFERHRAKWQIPLIKNFMRLNRLIHHV